MAYRKQYSEDGEIPEAGGGEEGEINHNNTNHRPPPFRGRMWRGRGNRGRGGRSPFRGGSFRGRPTDPRFRGGGGGGRFPSGRGFNNNDGRGGGGGGIYGGGDHPGRGGGFGGGDHPGGRGGSFGGSFDGGFEGGLPQHPRNNNDYPPEGPPSSVPPPYDNNNNMNRLAFDGRPPPPPPLNNNNNFDRRPSSSDVGFGGGDGPPHYHHRPTDFAAPPPNNDHPQQQQPPQLPFDNRQVSNSSNDGFGGPPPPSFPPPPDTRFGGPPPPSHHDDPRGVPRFASGGRAPLQQHHQHHHHNDPPYGGGRFGGGGRGGFTPPPDRRPSSDRPFANPLPWQTSINDDNNSRLPPRLDERQRSLDGSTEQLLGEQQQQQPPLFRRRSSDTFYRGSRGGRSSPRGGGRRSNSFRSSIKSTNSDWSSSSPHDRKPSLQFFQTAAAAKEKKNSPVPPPLSLSGTPNLPAASAPPAAAPPVPAVAPPLVTSALGEEHVERSEKVVSQVSELLGNVDFSSSSASAATSTTTTEISKLPSKQQILMAVGKMDAQIKAAQKQAAEKRAAAQTTAEQEARERQTRQEQAAAKAQRDAQARLRAQEEQRTEKEQVHEAEIQVYIDQQQALFDSKLEQSSNDLAEKLGAAREEEEKKMRESLGEQMIATADNFDKDIAKARKDHDKATTQVKKTETRLSNVEKDYRSKLEKMDRKAEPEEEAVDPCDFVSCIIAENKKRAAEAHMQSLSLVSLEDDDNDSVTEELENARDPKHDKTTLEWAQLTRQVTGKDNALYQEASDAPYYEVHEENHEVIAPLVAEYIRDKHNRLNQHWTESAYEYEYRKKVYEKQQHLSLHGQGKNKKKHAVPIHQSIFASSTAPKPVQATVPGTTGARSSSNPYRRARRGNEVRSEYEQEQIIAQIAAKEALEVRISHGGCEIPRQIGDLERQLEGQFENTFKAQRIDVVQQEIDLKNTNVWTDMEKSIFLDRWLQFPKDFKKIASFLRNKTTKDCVRFYYDSKQSVPYKGALREHVMRRKRRGEYHVWDATVEAALSVGAEVQAGVSEEKPLVILLPEDDHTYKTRFFHPMQREVFEGILPVIGESAAAMQEEGDGKKKCGRKRRLREPLFTLDPEQAKFLKTTEADEKLERSPSRSSMAETEDSYIDGTDDAAPARKTPQKWTSEEKRIFKETLEKYGRNWDKLSEAVGTKTNKQIKNYYYDFKKQQGRGRLERKGRRSDRSASRTPPPTASASNRMPDTPASDASGYDDAAALARERAHLATLYERHSQQHPAAHQFRSGDVYGLHPEAAESSLSHSGTSTPDPMELYVQQALLQQNQLLNDETVRQLLQRQSHASQHQQILASLLPWVNAGGLSSHTQAPALQNDWNETHQLQTLLQQRQQQQQQQHHHHQQHSHSNHLAALGLSGLAGLGSHGLSSSSSQHHHSIQQQHQQHQQDEEAQQLALARHLLNLQNTGSSSSDAMDLLMRSLSDRGGNPGNGNPPGPH